MILAKNSGLMNHKALVRETVAIIKKYHEDNPDLETIDEEGLELLQKVLSFNY